MSQHIISTSMEFDHPSLYLIITIISYFKMISYIPFFFFPETEWQDEEEAMAWNLKGKK